MASEPFNVAKGRAIEFHERVENSDPTNAVLVLVLLVASSEADATLRDYDTLAAVLAGANTEATFTNYARIVLDDTDVTASTIDDTNDRREADFADQTWSAAGGASNNALDKLLICYDSDSTGGTDANIVPVGHYDFSITTNGGDITAQLNAAGYYRAA